MRWHSEDEIKKRMTKKILRNQEFFEKYLKKINNYNNETERLESAQRLARFAVANPTGYFTSNILEKIFTDCAKQHDLDNYNIPYSKNSFLHVMTTAYLTGGHTRVVERWIQQSPNEQKHSIVILNQGNVPYPKDFLNSITTDKNGTLYLFDTDEQIINKSLRLRKLGMSYEYVILHIHMDDPTALIAFGTEKFTRPIIFFNHADHLFWLGKSIADIVADIRTCTSITESHRGIENRYMLGVPSEENKIQISKTETRLGIIEQFNLPIDSKIIVTSGSSIKYKSYLNHSLSEIITKYIAEIENTYCIVIGPDKSIKQWKNAWKKSNGKVIAIGNVPYHKGYLDYVNSANLIIDSWPMGGGTALIDAISLRKPVLSLKQPLGQFDYIVNSDAYCINIDEFYEKMTRILSDDIYASYLNSNIYTKYCADHSLSEWSKKLKELIILTPKHHFIKDLTNAVDYHMVDEYSLCNYSLYSIGLNEIKYYFYVFIFLRTPLDKIEKMIKKIINHFRI